MVEASQGTPWPKIPGFVFFCFFVSGFVFLFFFQHFGVLLFFLLVLEVMFEWILFC